MFFIHKLRAVHQLPMYQKCVLSNEMVRSMKTYIQLVLHTLSRTVHSCPSWFKNKHLEIKHFCSQRLEWTLPLSHDKWVTLHFLYFSEASIHDNAGPWGDDRSQPKLLHEERIPIIFVSFVLRFNLYTVKCMYLRCLTWWVLTIASTHVTITPIKKWSIAFREFLQSFQFLLTLLHQPPLTQGNCWLDFCPYELVLT